MSPTWLAGAGGSDTFGCRREQRGSQGSVLGSWWCRGPPQCPGRVSGGPSSQWDPHWMQTHFPPAPQARKNPSSSSSGVWLPPGTGRSPRHSALPRFGYLLRGCFRTAWTGRGDNGAAPAPFWPSENSHIPPSRAPGLGGGGGVTTAPLMIFPAGEGAAEPPWITPGREQDSASGAAAGSWL